MTLSRRKTLGIIGGGTIFAATGAAGFAVTRQPNTAHVPWDRAGDYADDRMRALSHAILAPNPHNRQPWLVDLSTPDQVTLYADPDRLLPHTDPFSRQIVIGLGCFLEVMRMAAAEEGRGVTFDLFPEGSDELDLDARPVAVAWFGGPATPDPLFAQVPHRRTLKDPYDLNRPVSDDTLAAIAASVMHGSGVGVTNDEARVTALRRLTREALLVEIETPVTYRESVDLFRIGRAEVDANPDGIDFSGPLFESMRLAGLMTREKALDPGSIAYREGVRAVLDNADTAMGFVWQTTPGNTRAEQIRAGQDWVRLNLAATALGVGVQPMSQPLQEYPEMGDLYRQAHQTLAPGGETVQMLARLGYGRMPGPSPRWPLGSRVIG